MMKSDIIIKQLDSTDQLSFDEMLGVVAQLTVPKNKRCLQWLKTKEQHESFRNRNLKIEQ